MPLKTGMPRDVDERKKRKALRKIRKAAMLAEQGVGPPLSDWEKQFLEEVEEPLRAALPQVTRTVKAADEMMQVVAGPAMAVAPGLTQLAETLNNPAFQRVPLQLGQMTDLLGELSQRLAPLGQLAESAGGMFGGFRLPGFPSPGSSRPPATSDASAEDGDAVVPDPEPASATKKAAKKKTTASKKKATSSRSKKKTATAKRSND